uniref:Kinesin motor domain-containing protein n=1 Tax=Seriola dumerili TaxID=41447 RepID=A0A3B4T731_SERDU
SKRKMTEESAVKVCVRLQVKELTFIYLMLTLTVNLYQDIAKPLVVSTVEGYNGTIFAYGQTSSGKTFTMMGSDQTPGVIPLAVEDVFQTIKNKEFLLRVSYMEIYNETVTDLLVDSWKRRPLEVRETINVSEPFRNLEINDFSSNLDHISCKDSVWICDHLLLAERQPY